MSNSFNDIDYLYDYINNFESFESYESDTKTHHVPNRRKEIQSLLHSLTSDYKIKQLYGNFFQKF